MAADQTPSGLPPRGTPARGGFRAKVVIFMLPLLLPIGQPNSAGFRDGAHAQRGAAQASSLPLPLPGRENPDAR